MRVLALTEPRALRLFLLACLWFAFPLSAGTTAAQQDEPDADLAGATGEKPDSESVAVETLRLKAAQIRELIDGTLDTSVEPASILSLDLGATRSRRDLETLLEELDRAVAPTPRGRPSGRPLRGTKDETPLAQAQRELAEARAAFLSLPPERRETILAEHEARRREAEAGAASAAIDTLGPELLALQAAAQSNPVAADLLRIKDAQDRFEDEIESARTEIEASLDRALTWTRRVRDLRDAETPPTNKSEEADRLYPLLIEELTKLRGELAQALDQVRAEPAEIPGPLHVEELDGAVGIEEDALRTVRMKLDANAAELQTAEAALRWERATGLRDAVVMMNRARLQLFEMLKEPLRDKLEGFGPEGVAQAKRELNQIALEARYHVLALPRKARATVKEMRSSPGRAVGVLLEVFLLLAVFWWWRRRADGLLEDMRRSWLQKRPQTFVTRGVSTLAWYARRVRGPVEWFALLVVLLTVIAEAGDVPEMEYLRIAAGWLLAGAFVVELIEAVASRQGFSSESTAKLRFRSLLLVGISIVIVGLILSLTQAIVGRGAIFAWVVSSIYVLALPIFVLLVIWWMQPIFERAKGRESSRVLRWVARHDHGLLKFPAAAIGGAYLWIEGVLAFFVNRVSDLAPLRRLLGYLFRRGVEKSNTAAQVEQGTEPLPRDLEDALDRAAEAPESLVTSYMSDRVHAMRALVRSDDEAVVAVVGERGVGKTTFLNRVTSDLEPGEVCSVQCQPGGFSVLLKELARALGLPDAATEAEIITALQTNPPTVVRVDDAQRLVRPLIGGLQDIDRLVRLTRLANPDTCWFIAIGMPVWQYLRRARGERASFDQVVELGPWDEAQLTKLISQRTSVAGIDPRFDRLIVPRQLHTSPVSDEERTRRDFHRVLWDYSDGNPRVALHFWKQSLYRKPPDEDIYVRLFSAPSTSELDGLPSTSYFVLRTVVQLELAVERDVVTCTDLSPAEVADALRAARVHGYLDEHDHLFEIDIHWYRAITNILRRKHLLLL